MDVMSTTVFFREQYDAHRLLLHANRLIFVHPVLKKKLVLNARLDETFVRVLQKMEMTFDTNYLQTTVVMDSE